MCDLKSTKSPKNESENNNIVIPLPKYNYRLAKFVLENNTDRKLYVQSLFTTPSILKDFKIRKDLKGNVIKIVRKSKVPKEDTLGYTYKEEDETKWFLYEKLTNIVIYQENINEWIFVYENDLIEDRITGKRYHVLFIDDKLFLQDLQTREYLTPYHLMKSIHTVDMPIRLIGEDHFDQVLNRTFKQNIHMFNGSVISHVYSESNYERHKKREKELKDSQRKKIESNIIKAEELKKSQESKKPLKDAHIIVHLSDSCTKEYLFIDKKLYDKFCDLIVRNELFYHFIIDNINELYFDKLKKGSPLIEQMVALDMGKIFSIVKLVVMGKSELALKILNEMDTAPRTEMIILIKHNVNFFTEIKNQSI